ncbi:hypothetical protein E4U49_006695, partial [Claviceps purpurea]
EKQYNWKGVFCPAQAVSSSTVAYAITVHEPRATTLNLKVVDISLCEITPGLTCEAVLRVQHSTASCSCPFGHRAIRGTTIPERDTRGADVLWHRYDHLVADAVKADSSHYYKYNTRQLVVSEHWRSLGGFTWVGNPGRRLVAYSMFHPYVSIGRRFGLTAA